MNRSAMRMDTLPPTSADGGLYFILDTNRKPARVGYARWREQQRTRVPVVADDRIGGRRVVTRFAGTKLGTSAGDSLWFVTLSDGVPVAQSATWGEAVRTHRLIVGWMQGASP